MNLLVNSVKLNMKSTVSSMQVNVYISSPGVQTTCLHLWAEEAYRNVRGQLEPVNQSLVVSASSSVMESHDTVERIERRVLDSNPIMEAFDAKKFRGRLEKELGDNGSISWDKFSKVPHFTVAHYAGKVDYQTQGMVEKNKDPVPTELIALLQTSDNLLLQQIFSEQQTETSPTKGLSKVTVVSKFKNSLESLMRILHNTTPHYTSLHQAPTPTVRRLSFRKEEVIGQLEACGIVETIHISAAGFPLRLLEDQRKNILSQCAFTIQCCWMRFQLRRRRARRQSATPDPSSRAVLACQERGTEVGPSRVRHPEHLEEVEGWSCFKGSVKLHCQRSPLLYADRQPELKTNVTGFNEILLEKTL
ncbi:unnamed protein product [Lampetra planeri]